MTMMTMPSFLFALRSPGIENPRRPLPRPSPERRGEKQASGCRRLKIPGWKKQASCGRDLFEDRGSLKAVVRDSWFVFRENQVVTIDYKSAAGPSTSHESRATYHGFSGRMSGNERIYAQKAGLPLCFSRFQLTVIRSTGLRWASQWW